MAGRGQAPKDPEKLARRNKDAAFETLPAEGYTGEYPPLPATWSQTVLEKVATGDGEHELVAREEKVVYLDDTREWYTDHATSPQATKFVATDWRRLRMIAPLVDQYLRRPSKDLASEIRLQETLLGATVLDRQRMRMRVGEPATAGTASSGGDGGGRFSHLRVVDDATG